MEFTRLGDTLLNRRTHEKDLIVLTSVKPFVRKLKDAISLQEGKSRQTEGNAIIRSIAFRFSHRIRNEIR